MLFMQTAKTGLIGIVLCSICLTAQAAERQWKHVLILHSYHRGFTFTEAEIEGINSVLDPESAWIEQHVVHMDAKRITDAAYEQALRQLLQIQFAKVKFDAVLVTDNDALDFVVHNRAALFRDIPVFFAGINDFQDSMLAGEPRITGVVEDSEYAATIDLALKLRPATTRIVAVSDSTTTGNAHTDAIQRLAPAYQGKAELVLWSLGDMTMGDMCGQLESLKEDSVVLLLNHYRDRDGQVYSHNESMELLLRASPVPVFAVNETRLGWGVLGGKLIRGRNQGRIAAQMMVRVLRGEDIARIPIELKSPNDWMFDYAALRRWGIDESALPGGSIIVNRPVSFYAAHRQIILGSAGVALMLIGIIWLQATAIARRRVAEAALFKAIRDRDEAEQQLRQSQKMEAVGRLAGGVAHDFNNLLTAILGYAELAMDRCGDASPLHAELEQISKAGQQAAGLTRQLLAFSRKQVIAPVVLDLNELVTHSRKMLQRLIGEDIELVYFQKPDAGRIKADPSQIEQIFLNLAANARDAMPKGGKLTFETARVAITEEYVRTHVDARPGLWTMLAASDNGQGMDETVRQHIFEPFFTTKARGKGTGLGLATVYGIVKQNSGFINVYSEPGVGTTFKIYFPRVDELPAPTPKVESAPLPPGTATILLVEDDDGVRRLARMTLEQRGYRVLTAAQAADAISIFEREGPAIDLLITDVIMPGMNGRQLYERLTSLKPGLKALFMSGYTENVIAEHGILDAGINFIQKPYGMNQFARKVHTLLSAGPS